MKEEQKSHLQISNEGLQKAIEAIAKKVMNLIVFYPEKVQNIELHMAELYALIKRGRQRFEEVVEDMDVDKREQEALEEGARWERNLSAEAVSWYQHLGYNIGGR